MNVGCIRYFGVFPLSTVITLVFESVWVRWSESVFKETLMKIQLGSKSTQVQEVNQTWQKCVK